MFFVAISLLIFGNCATPSRVDNMEGKAISKVTIRQVGPKSVEEKRLRAHVGSAAGSVYKSERVDNDIKALYESGLVNDVRVLAEPEKNGVELIYELQTRSPMGPSPGFIGNSVFSDQRLAKESGLRAEQMFDRPAVLAAARKIEAFYHANGRPKANVTAKFDVPAPFVPPFVFFIEEGPGPSR